MTGELSNHLWQSTWYAVAIGAFTLAFRRNYATVRYWLWFSASLKFFVPFSLLLDLGVFLRAWMALSERVAVPDAAPGLVFTIGQVVQPFPDKVSFAFGSSDRGDWVSIVMLSAWVAGFLCIAALRLQAWRRIRRAVQSSIPMHVTVRGIPRGLDIRCSPDVLEPGVAGIRRSTLLLPADIHERLTGPQFEAVLAHEFCHVRRRDNLLAALHMVVEATFWFHPLVWWIGARLLTERERACDEAVLDLQVAPLTYAEGILNVCKHCVKPPVPWLSAIGRGNVKQRLEAIMTNPQRFRLSRANKVFLATAALSVVVLPLLIGARNSSGEAKEFSSASLTASNNPAPGGNVEITPGRFRGKDLALQWLILIAWRIRSHNLSGALPSWTASERYDIDAAIDKSTGDDQILQALQSLLKERFHLTAHAETKQEPVYFLTLGNSRVSMPVGSCVPARKDLPNECFSRRTEGTAEILDWKGVTMSDPAGIAYRSLSWWLAAPLGRPVIDKTGLKGSFDVHLRWAGLAGQGAPSLDAAIQEQLGLRLESGRGPVDFMVVDHVEKPALN